MDVPQTQTLTDAVGNFQERFGLPDFKWSVRAKIAIDDFMNAAWARAHDNDLG
jgi:hypothetical protein